MVDMGRGFRMMIGALLPVGLALTGCTATMADRPATMTQQGHWSQADAATALAVANKAANWQLANMDNPQEWINYISGETENPVGWVQATFLLGLADYAAATKQPGYVAWLESIAMRERWKLAKRPFHADDHLIGQVYFDLADANVETANLVPTRTGLDYVLANRPTNTLMHPQADGDPRCHARWCWADALFMAPATWWDAAKAFDDDKYAQFAHEEFVASADLLFDKDEALFFRDSRFFDMRGEDDEKLFWSRGNGWVYGGLVNLLRIMDDSDPRRPYYRDLFVKMSDRLVELQTDNGMWRASLLATSATPPETSGTGFFTYGLAWGLNEGILSGAQYDRAAKSGWDALMRNVDEDGRLGFVQQVGARPAGVKQEDSQYYGTGAMLFAASQVIELGSNAR